MNKDCNYGLSLATIMAMAVAGTMTSCSTPNSGSSTNTTTDSCMTEQETPAAASETCTVFATDSITVEKSMEFVNSENESTPITFSATVDYPQDGNAKTYKALNDRVRAFISDELELGRDRRITNKEVLSESAKIFMNYIRTTKESGENDFEYGAEKVINIRKVYEDEKYLTYLVYNYGFEGGAHGSYIITGVTFVKEDGSQITWENIKKTDELQKDITKGIAANYDMNMDEFMNNSGLVQEEPEKLSDGTSVLRWPSSNPYLTEGGWTFTYQAYEIMSYAEGAPSGIVPREKVEFQE